MNFLDILQLALYAICLQAVPFFAISQQQREHCFLNKKYSRKYFGFDSRDRPDIPLLPLLAHCLRVQNPLLCLSSATNEEHVILGNILGLISREFSETP